jgi:alkylated DNA repair dioxygenase AlkB
MNAPVIYRPNFIGTMKITNEGMFEHLWETLPWERRFDAPRRECWMSTLNLPYSYGRGVGRRTYDPLPWHQTVVEIQAQLNADLGVFFEGCFVNGYEGAKDQLGWHADDSPEIDPTKPIAVVSFGYPREIWFSLIDGTEIEKQMLEDRSLLVMAAGMQQTHQHRIPKSSRSDCGRRISLTYRGLRAVPAATNGEHR